ncbi:MAG: anion permease [Candidatus Eremiobacteraeota bacterium]|nr:anion permease [Candidatus Eremiobacteraeota bacterium]
MTVFGMLSRPLRIPEWCWAVVGAVLLLAFGLIHAHQAAVAILRGTQVYFFLAGMMALAELARNEGLFEWLASQAVLAARGSSFMLFALIFGIGVIVTMFLSNDATAIVLTPAVLAASRRAGVAPLPFLFACALVANAASFLLPIGNPANLVVYGNELPPLIPWIATFGAASIAAIGSTFLILVLLFRSQFGEYVDERKHQSLTPRQRLSSGLLPCAVIGLVYASALGYAIGTATLAAGVICTVIVGASDRKTVVRTLRGITWGIIPLVAALFIIVQALDANGALYVVRSWFEAVSAYSHPLDVLAIGGIVAIGCNVLNNLPAALLTSFALTGDASSPVRHAALVAVNLSPNISLTGSLATLLWLAMLRREGIDCSAWQFFRIGIVVTVPSLVIALLLTQ